jgi:GNAT superfamily N-acetyltransferase
VDGIRIREALPADVVIVERLLLEAARWVDAMGVVMWEAGELARDRLADEVAAGQFFIADAGGAAAGVVRFQLEDPLFWPDRPAGEAAFVHRLAVSRAFKGQGVSRALLEWTVDRARDLGRQYLRLDCDASRPKLQALYEGFGFRLHSFRQVGPYFVARYEYPLRGEDA